MQKTWCQHRVKNEEFMLIRACDPMCDLPDLGSTQWSKGLSADREP